MHALLQPVFQPLGIGIQDDRLGHTTIVETQRRGCFFDESAMLLQRIHYNTLSFNKGCTPGFTMASLLFFT